MFFCGSALKFQCRSLREFDLPPEPSGDHEKEAILIGLVHLAFPNGRVQLWLRFHGLQCPGFGHILGKVFTCAQRNLDIYTSVWMILINIPVPEYRILFAAIFKYKGVNSTVAYCGLSTIKCQHDPPHLEQCERRTCNLKVSISMSPI